VLIRASLPAVVRTIVDADFLECWASVVSHLGEWGSWMPGLKSWTQTGQ